MVYKAILRVKSQKIKNLKNMEKSDFVEVARGLGAEGPGQFFLYN